MDKTSFLSAQANTENRKTILRSIVDWDQAIEAWNNVTQNILRRPFGKVLKKNIVCNMEVVGSMFDITKSGTFVTK